MPRPSSRLAPSRSRSVWRASRVLFFSLKCSVSEGSLRREGPPRKGGSLHTPAHSCTRLPLCLPISELTLPINAAAQISSPAGKPTPIELTAKKEIEAREG